MAQVQGTPFRKSRYLAVVLRYSIIGSSLAFLLNQPKVLKSTAKNLLRIRG